MSIFCKHKYEEVERFVTIAMNGNIKGSGLDEMKKMIEACQPQTTILYKCTVCTKPKKLKISGESIKKL